MVWGLMPDRLPKPLTPGEREPTQEDGGGNRDLRKEGPIYTTTPRNCELGVGTVEPLLCLGGTHGESLLIQSLASDPKGREEKGLSIQQLRETGEHLVSGIRLLKMANPFK